MINMIECDEKNVGFVENECNILMKWSWEMKDMKWVHMMMFIDVDDHVNEVYNTDIIIVSIIIIIITIIVVIIVILSLSILLVSLFLLLLLL